MRWQERVGSYVSDGSLVGYHPYWLLDAKLLWSMPEDSGSKSQLSACNFQLSELYVQATNLTNHRYRDLGAVPQPGIWVMAGARVRLK